MMSMACKVTLLLLIFLIRHSHPQFVFKRYSEKDSSTLQIPKEFLYQGNEHAIANRRHLFKHTLNEKCAKGHGMGVGFHIQTPYVDLGMMNGTDWVLGGIFPHVISDMLRYCCPQSQIEYAKFMTSISDVEMYFRNHEHPEDFDITFPAYGSKEQAKFMDFPFIPIVTAPKISILVHEHSWREVKKRVESLMSTIANAWPMLVFIFVSASLAGIIMWGLDRKKNSQQFPKPFMKGMWEGVWCAFVTMTTVGYGDRAPKSLLGRIFCMMWILLGITLISTFTGLVASAIQTSTNEEFTMRGSVIGAIQGSVEFQVGVGLNAQMVPYRNIFEMLEDLSKETRLHAALVDNFILSASMKIIEQLDIHVESELDHPVTYGFVLSDNSTNVEKCFRRYKNHHMQKMFEVIAAKLIPIKSSGSFQRIMEASVVKEAFYDQMSFKTVLYVESGVLFVALLIGSLAEFRIHGKQAMGNRVIWMLKKIGFSKTLDDVSRNSSIAEKGFLATENMDRKDATVVIEVEQLNAPKKDDIDKLIKQYEEFHASWINRIRACSIANSESSVQ